MHSTVLNNMLDIKAVEDTVSASEECLGWDHGYLFYVFIK